MITRAADTPNSKLFSIVIATAAPVNPARMEVRKPRSDLIHPINSEIEITGNNVRPGIAVMLSAIDEC